MEKLPASLVILGGGPIGLEMAQAFSRLGTKVTVLQSNAQLLPKEDPDVAAFVHQKLSAEGVEIFLNAKALSVETQAGKIKLIFEKDEAIREIIAEKLLVAAGRQPNIEGLNLEKIGVLLDRRGIKVDDRLRTSVKNIYACGDVTGGLQFTHVAGYQAGIAMMNICFPVIPLLRLPIKANYAHVPWCTYLDPEIASIGLNEARAKAAGIDYVVHKEQLKNNDRAKAEGETEGFVKVLLKKSGRVMGVQIISFHAGDLIHEWVPVLNGKMSLQTIANSIHAYPTIAEINKTAGLNYFLAAPAWTKLRMLLNW